MCFWLITGLGNPGKQYESTRHNLGFWAIEHCSAQWCIPLSQQNHHALWGKGQVGQTSVIISKPQTFMNLSGFSVKSLMSLWEISPSHLIVIHDDMDLQLGSVRIRNHGSSGGHKGIKSIIEELNAENFLRIRIGIGKPGPDTDPVDYVLSEFLPSEREKMLHVIKKTDKISEVIIIDGPQEAMNLFNY